MEVLKVTLVFFLFKNAKAYNTSTMERELLPLLKSSLENIFVDQIEDITRYLEKMNDRHLSNSEIGRLLRYEEIKPKLVAESRRGRSMKKMAMAMTPLVFHMGAASTWMVLTGLMATKSVLIGTILLIFKIAVSSAKIASFFTAWKGKTHHHDGWSWLPHHDHHDLDLAHPWHHEHPDYHSYSPDWTSGHEYKTIPVGPPSDEQ